MESFTQRGRHIVTPGPIPAGSSVTTKRAWPKSGSLILPPTETTGPSGGLALRRPLTPAGIFSRPLETEHSIRLSFQTDFLTRATSETALLSFLPQTILSR